MCRVIFLAVSNFGWSVGRSVVNIPSPLPFVVVIEVMHSPAQPSPAVKLKERERDLRDLRGWFEVVWKVVFVRHPSPPPHTIFYKRQLFLWNVSALHLLCFCLQMELGDTPPISLVSHHFTADYCRQKLPITNQNISQYYLQWGSGKSAKKKLPIMSAAVASTSSGTDARRSKALSDYRKKLMEHREIEAKVKECKWRRGKGRERWGVRRRERLAAKKKRRADLHYSNTLSPSPSHPLCLLEKCDWGCASSTRTTTSRKTISRPSRALARLLQKSWSNWMRKSVR